MKFKSVLSFVARLLRSICIPIKIGLEPISIFRRVSIKVLYFLSYLWNPRMDPYQTITDSALVEYKMSMKFW